MQLASKFYYFIFVHLQHFLHDSLVLLFSKLPEDFRVEGFLDNIKQTCLGIVNRFVSVSLRGYHGLYPHVIQQLFSFFECFFVPLFHDFIVFPFVHEIQSWNFFHSIIASPSNQESFRFTAVFDDFAVFPNCRAIFFHPSRESSRKSFGN